MIAKEVVSENHDGNGEDVMHAVYFCCERVRTLEVAWMDCRLNRAYY